MRVIALGTGLLGAETLKYDARIKAKKCEADLQSSISCERT
jgi:hypothetical protein